MYSLGVDIGGSHISSCMYEHSYKSLLRDSKICMPVNNKGTASEIIADWKSAICQTISIANVEYSGLGIAIPGPFDYRNGISLIRGVNKYDSLYKVDIKTKLAKVLDIGTSQIQFINDAVSFAFTESLVGKASGFRRMVGITLGTGFGSAFFEDGKAVESGNNVPEYGVLFDKFHGVQKADDLFSTRGITNQYKKISGKEVASVFDLCQKIPTDLDALKTFKWFGRELGIFLSFYLGQFGAEVLVIGGNISRAFKFFEGDLKEQLDNIPIYVSDYGEDAAIIGAALQFENDPSPSAKT